MVKVKDPTGVTFALLLVGGVSNGLLLASGREPPIASVATKANRADLTFRFPMLVHIGYVSK